MRQERLEKRPEKSTYTPIFVILVLSVLIIISIFIYFKFFKAEVIAFSGFNWSEEPISVTVEDQNIQVQPGEMFKFQKKIRGKISVNIDHEDGRNIRKTFYDIPPEKGIVMEIISSTDIKQCVIQADVSSVYYKTAEDYSLEDVSIISDIPIESIYHSVDWINSLFVYPGNYSKELLPEKLYEDEQVLGLFFVECSNLENEENLLSDVLGSIYYDRN